MHWRQRFRRFAWLAAAVGVRAAWGQFATAPACVLDAVSRPAYIAAGDLNRDGRTDLAVSSWPRRAGDPEEYDPARGRVLIFYQKRGGFRAPADKTLSFVAPLSLLIGDFDRDGKNDLAAVGGRQWLHLFLGTDDLARDAGNWNCNQYCPGPVLAARLNPGGLADFLVGPVWRKWMGGKRYLRGYFYAPAEEDANGGSLVTDLNYDGYPDVVFLTHRPSGAIRIYYGPFLQQRVKAHDVVQRVTLAAPAPALAVAVADVSGDGRRDLLVCVSPPKRPAAGALCLFFQNAPIGFDDRAKPSAAIAGLAGPLLAADVNGDGLADIVTARARPGAVCVFLQRRGCAFPSSAAQADQTLRAPGRTLALCLADMNGDRRPDLFVASQPERGPGAIRLFLSAPARR